MKKYWLILILFMTSVGSTLAHAAQLYSRFTDHQLVQIMHRNGYKSVRLLKPRLIVITHNSHSYLLINHKDGDLQLHYGFKGIRISYKDINEWNRKKRLSRAFLRRNQHPALEADLLSDGGVTQANVVKFFDVFRLSVRAYRIFLKTHGHRAPSANSPSSQPKNLNTPLMNSLI